MIVAVLKVVKVSWILNASTAKAKSVQIQIFFSLLIFDIIKKSSRFFFLNLWFRSHTVLPMHIWYWIWCIFVKAWSVRCVPVWFVFFYFPLHGNHCPHKTAFIWSENKTIQRSQWRNMKVTGLISIQGEVSIHIKHIVVSQCLKL